MTRLLELAGRHLEDIAILRRDIHAHPELGFEEKRTSALIAGKLREWGVEVTEGIATTGVVGTIPGRRQGQRSIGLRADMDALAMCEANQFAHASRFQGRMHGCGHDGHTAMLLGAAQLLAEDPDFEGTVNLIFQPAEEGRGGAQAMLAERLFERFPCDRIFGMHSLPEYPVGTFATRSRELMAASGRWRVEFSGSGGHGGYGPHLANDLSIVAAHFILGLQTIISRNLPPTESAVISVGHIGAGDPEGLNVLPSRLQIGGTIRAFKEGTQRLLETRIREHAERFAATEGATATVKCWWNSMPLVNDPEATEVAVAAASSVVGAEAVSARMDLVTGGEDFSYMLNRRPGAFVMLGNGRHEGDGGDAIHTPRYDFNDKALPFGIAYWLAVVNRELKGRLGAA